MKKTSKRAISLLLTLTLMFSAVMMFPSTASAAYPKAFSFTYSDGTFSGSISFLTQSASAITKFTSTYGMTSNATVHYQYRENATGKLASYSNSAYKSDASTSVTATAIASPPNRGIFSNFLSADGVHTGKTSQHTHIDA